MTLLNSHQSVTQLWFTLANCVGIVYALTINVMAYRRTGHGGSKYAYAITAAFAAVYLVAYAVLSFTEVRPLDWFNVMRGVSPMVWPTVWAMHATSKVFSNQSERWGDAVIEVVKARLVDDPLVSDS